MSHTTIYFLTETNDVDEAKSRVNAYLENETFFDYSEIQHELSGPLEIKWNDIDAFLHGWGWNEDADAFLEKAEDYKDRGDLGMCGYNLIRAGELYAQYLTIDAYIYNIDSSDYSIPDQAEGWMVIAVDFHY